MNFSAPKTPAVRERFSGPFVVAGVLIGFLLLLLFLYPEQPLRRLLSQRGEQTPAGRVYLEAALQRNPDDHQLRLALAHTWLSSGCYRKALVTLDGFRPALPDEVRREADRLRYAILREQLQMEEGDQRSRATFQALAHDQLKTARNDQELAQLEFDAASLALPDIALAARQRRAQLRPAPEAARMTAGQYRNEAAAAFAAMEKAANVAERRACFLNGVRALQGGNLPLEALRQGEQHLAPLADDQEALVAMTRVALAAGRPDKAQLFIRRALGMAKKP